MHAVAAESAPSPVTPSVPPDPGNRSIPGEGLMRVACIGPAPEFSSLPRVITRPVQVRIPCMEIMRLNVDDPRAGEYMCGLALHSYMPAGSRQILCVVQCNDGEIRHLPFGVLEVVSPLGCAETPNDDIDGLQDSEYSDGEGHDSSYVIRGEVDEDVVDALMDMEGEWPHPSLLDQPHSPSAEGTIPVRGPPQNQHNSDAPLQQGEG